MARITYNPTTIGGAMVASAIDHVAKAQQLLARAKSMADSAAAGGATPALLEGGSEFGVGTGAGATFYTAVANAKVNVGAITAAALADLDMGG